MTFTPRPFSNMTAPWIYRPLNSDDPDWEDNAVSNSMAWASDTVVPKWCKEDGHWTFKVTKPLWAECTCCLTFRGVIIGLALGLPLGVFVGAIV